MPSPIPSPFYSHAPIPIRERERNKYRAFLYPIAMSSVSETGTGAPVTGPAPARAPSAGAGIWQAEHTFIIEVPEEILRVFDDEFGIPFEDYYVDVIREEVNATQVTGRIRARIWFNYEHYKYDTDPDLSITIGYYHYHPIASGYWLYYLSAETVRKRLESLRRSEGSA